MRHDCPQLIVDTSEMLGVPLFTAEALLRFCEWSKEALRLEWARDPVQTCLRAGLAPPYSILGLVPSQQPSQHAQYRTTAARQGSFCEQPKHITNSFYREVSAWLTIS